MKALFCQNECGLEAPIARSMERVMLPVDSLPFSKEGFGEQDRKHLKERLESGEYLYVFSLGFEPGISAVCQDTLIPYLSWVTECPAPGLYDSAVGNPCNFIFCFDRALCEELQKLNPGRIFHLPVAAEAEGEEAPRGEEASQEDRAEISFVGSLYAGHIRLDDLREPSYFLRGYLDALIGAQTLICGGDLLGEALAEPMVREFKKQIDFYRLPEGSSYTDRKVMTDLYLREAVSRQERRELLRAVSERYRINVYTEDGAEAEGILPSVAVIRGSLDARRRNEIYRTSRINLYIPAREARTGIGHELFDIMAAGGFVLAAYQEEIPELFQVGEQLEVFMDKEELLEKTAYYLSHGEERRRIAANGRLAVAEYHTWEARCEAMAGAVFGEKEEMDYE